MASQNFPWIGCKGKGHRKTEKGMEDTPFLILEEIRLKVSGVRSCVASGASSRHG